MSIKFNTIFQTFEKQVRDFPEKFDLDNLKVWIELMDEEIEKSYVVLQNTLEYEHISLEPREPNSPPRLRFKKILPEHSKALKDFLTLKEKLILTKEEELSQREIRQWLLFEIFRLEIEIFESIILRYEYLNTQEKTIFHYLQILLKANSFKNIKPKELLLNNLDSNKAIYLNYYGPVLSESLTAEIEYYQTEAKKIKRKLSNKKVKIITGMEINLSQTQLKKIYLEFRNNLHLVDLETKESDFISSLSGEPIPSTYQKIKWAEDIKLAVFIGEYVENSFKWRKCDYLFKDFKDLKKKYDSAKKYKPFIQTCRMFEDTMRKIVD